MSKQSGGKEQRANKQSNCRHVSIRRQIFHCECSIVCHYQQRYKCRCPAPSQRNQEIPRLAHFHRSFLCVLCVLCGQLYGLFSSFIGNWYWYWQHFHIGNISLFPLWPEWHNLASERSFGKAMDFADHVERQRKELERMLPTFAVNNRRPNALRSIMSPSWSGIFQTAL